MSGFKIINPLEFQLVAKNPVTSLLDSLSDLNNGLQITSKKYHVEKGAAADKHPIGTGAWEYVSSLPGNELVLKRNPTYWGAKTGFENLVIKEIPDGSARLVQSESGAVDISLLDAPLTGEAIANGLKVQTIKQIANCFIILGGTYPGTKYLDKSSPWIQANDPAKGKAIREALSLAIDRPLILKQVLHGEGQLAYGPLIQYNSVPELMDPSWKLPAYNPSEAKQMLAQGGYPNGFKITLYEYSDDVDTVAIAQAIAGMWKAIGIDVVERPVDESVLQPQEDSGKTGGLAWLKLGGFRPEPADTIQSYRSTLPDDRKFFDPMIDSTYNEMSSQPNHEKRLADAKALIQHLIDDMPVLTMFTVDMPWAVGPKVTGWAPTPGENFVNNLATAQPTS